MTPPPSRLCWVRVRGMAVFWPACVYASYSAAARHALDTLRLRQRKPVPDVEERVVAFLGVPAGASTAGGVAPNLQLCLVAQDELATHPWAGADDFGRVCRAHNVPEDAVARAAKHSAFRRACAQAQRFHDHAHDDEAASALLLEFLAGASGVARRPMAEIATATKKNQLAPTAAAADKTEHKPTPVAKTETKKAETETASLAPELVQACWALMEAEGWATFSQPDGAKLFAMPGVQFFEFRPNVTVFDSLETATRKFLARWTSSDANKENEPGQLDELFWATMVAQGWQTISSAQSELYVLPGTTFDRFVPNVTIFQTKRQAIARFLVGLIGSPKKKTAELETESDAEPAQSQEEEADVEMSQSNDEQEEEEEEEEEASGSEEDQSADEEEEIFTKTPRRHVRAPRDTERTKAAAPRGRRKPLAAKQEVRRVVPPFKCTQGKIEQELRARGWYWKPVPYKTALDGYMYFKPECVDMDESDIVPGQHCFAGFASVEMYLEESGLNHTITDKLRREHERSYSSYAVKEEKPHKTPTMRKKTLQTKPTPQVSVIEISDDDDEAEKEKENAQQNKLKRGAARRKPSPSQVRRIQTTYTAVNDVKFAHVWPKLQQKGWYYRPGRFSYDYFKPTAKRKKNLVHGEDFFYSPDEVEEYLKDTGEWTKLATQVLRAGETSEESERERQEGESTEEEVEISSTPVKRKASVVEDPDNAHTPVAKKARVDSEQAEDSFQTPPNDRTKKPSDDRAEEDSAETQDLTTLTQESNISPESTSAKARQEDSAKDSTTSLARNLNEAFTPSPRAEKLKQTPSLPVEENVPESELAERSISRLTLSYQPEVFAHRETEAKKIEDFCRGCFADRRGGSMYLSGAPGCGKSALLRALSDKIGDLHESYGNAPGSIVAVHLNAMGMSDFHQVFCKVAEHLTNKEYSDGEEAFEAIERGTNTAYKRSKALLLVLDEIDALGRTSMEGELCRLFELAHRSGHAFILVGIANQIDFTERHLASLQLQLPTVKPQVIVFKPYSYQTISEILMDRLGGPTNAARIVNSHGVSFIARKVAAQSGDVRLALDICRRVLQQKLSEVASAADYGAPVSLIDIVKTIKLVLEGKNRNNVASLPRNLQMILFASTRLVARTKAVVEDATTSTQTIYRVDDLYECYCDASHDAGVFKPLTRGEFRLGLETLSSEGMVGAAELKKQLVKLLCTPSELLQAFKTDAYFSRLI